MGHTSVIQNQFVVVFGGLNNGSNHESMISNDLYVLSLDGSPGCMLAKEITRKALVAP
jgi:hypothetical protein